jgi:flagellar biosynthesis component FlhA
LLAQQSKPMSSTIPKGWLPEILEVNISVDLVPELKRNQGRLFRRLAAIRAEHGVEGPLVRIRDETWLARQTYTVSLHGIRLTGRTLERPEDLEDELVRVVGDVWQQNADALQFLVAWQATITSLAEAT